MFNLKKLKFWAKSSHANNGKISLNELIWIGFNYTCGIAFPMALIGVYYLNNGVVLVYICYEFIMCFNCWWNCTCFY